MTLNRGHAYLEIIQQSGLTVLEHLSRHYGHSSEAEWQERIERGEVEVDGRHTQAGASLAAGQEVVWKRPPWNEPEVDTAWHVLYEDEAILAVYKPQGLPTLPGAGYLDSTLLSLVRLRHPHAAPMHRLGRGTSGLLLFALLPEAATALQEAWRTRGVLKAYRALGSGICVPDTLDITAPIGLVPHPRMGTVHGATATGKTSVTRAQVLERRGSSTLFQVHIETGRPHQIRIHLAWAGHPLVGDPLYGPGGLPLQGLVGVPGDGGYWLHSERLAFQHPLTGIAMDLWAPPPPELRRQGEAGPRGR